MDICTMHWEELKKLKDSLPDWKERTPEQVSLYNQLSWIDMIDSCFCYGELYSLDKYLNSSKYDLPISLKKQIMNEHLDFLRNNAVIHKGIGEDGEGVVYNSMSY